MVRKIDLAKSPPSHCPKVEFCEINKCPLHPDYQSLQNDSSDPATVHKEKCTSKRIRVEIGKAFNLPMQGMTPREFNATKQWEKLTQKEKEDRKEKLKQNSPISRLSDKGYMIAPKKKDFCKIHGQEEEIEPENGLENESLGVENES